MNVTTIGTTTQGDNVPRAREVRRSIQWPAPLSAAIVVVIAVALSAPPILHLTEIREPNAYAHVAFAQAIAQTGVLYPGHFLFHLLMVAVHGLFPVSWLQANVIVLLAMRGFLAVVVWHIVRKAIPDPNSANNALLAIAISLGLILASAVSFFSWSQGNYYIGYISPNLYVSQTLTALQPLALLTFFAVIRVVTSSQDPPLNDIILMAVLALLATLAKPSYTMVLLPAVGAFLLFRGQLVRVRRTGDTGPRLERGRWFRDWRSVLTLGAGLAAPALIGMLWVYESTYLSVQQISGTESSGIAIAPFKVMAYLQAAFVSDQFVPAWLLAKFFLSILFPLVVAVCFWPRIRRDARAILAWLQFGIGALFMYVLAEDPFFQAGNFTWSAHIALFILFVVSMLIVIESLFAGNRTGWTPWRYLTTNKAAVICFGAFILHVIGGYGIFAHPYVN